MKCMKGFGLAVLMGLAISSFAWGQEKKIGDAGEAKGELKSATGSGWSDIYWKIGDTLVTPAPNSPNRQKLIDAFKELEGKKVMAKGTWWRECCDKPHQIAVYHESGAWILRISELEADSQEKDQEKKVDVEKLIEQFGLKDKEKMEWLKLVSEKLKDKPELLSKKQREQLAEEILKDGDCQKYLKNEILQGLAKPQVEEVWFYLGALEHSDNKMRSSAALVLGQVVVWGKLEGGGGDIVKAIIGKLEDKGVDVRSSAAWALGEITAQGKLEGKLLEDSISAVERAMKKEKELLVRERFAEALKVLKQRKYKLEEEKK